MIYLDHNASSIPSSGHLKKLFEILETNRPANPSSQHALGRNASVYLTQARKNLAKALNCEAREIIFTSGGTEANNLATRGVVEKKLSTLPATETVSILTTAIEHPCILKTFEALEQKYPQQVELILIQPNAKGYIEILDVVEQIKENTILISIMAANNEIGTIQQTKQFGDFLHFMRWGNIPDEYAESAEEFKTQQEVFQQKLNPNITSTILQNLHFHVDSVQIFGKIKSELWMSAGYDSCAVSAHKVGAFQGVGALLLRRGRTYLPLQSGGAQEKNRRAGTENLPGILSFSLVCEEISEPEYWTKINTIKKFAHTIYDTLKNSESIVLNSQKENALPNTIHFSFKQETYCAEDIILNLDINGICVGSGAACSSGVTLPSHVLLAMGCEKHLANNTIRVSLGVENTEEEVSKFLNLFFKLIDKC